MTDLSKLAKPVYLFWGDWSCEILEIRDPKYWTMTVSRQKYDEGVTEWVLWSGGTVVLPTDDIGTPPLAVFRTDQPFVLMAMKAAFQKVSG